MYIRTVLPVKPEIINTIYYVTLYGYVVLIISGKTNTAETVPSRIATVQKLHYGIEIPFAKGTPTHEQNGVTTVNMFANKNVRSARILDNMNGRLGSCTGFTKFTRFETDYVMIINIH